MGKMRHKGAHGAFGELRFELISISILDILLGGCGEADFNFSVGILLQGNNGGTKVGCVTVPAKVLVGLVLS